VKSSALAKFNSSVTSTLLVQVQLEHGAEQKDTGLWEVDVDHKVTKRDNTECVLIVVTVQGNNFFKQ